MPANPMPASEQPQAAPQGMAPQEPQPEMPKGQSPQQQVLSGIDQQFQAQKLLSDERDKVLKQRESALMDFDTHNQQVLAENNAERQRLEQDVKDGAINPEQFWTGDKNGNGGHSRIMAGIGMLIAGFNPTGSPNAAIQYLEKQMDNNLKAQQANLDSKQSLLRANMQHFGNLKDAMAMSRAQMNDMMAVQLEQAANKAATPAAKAQAMQAAGMFRMQADAQSAQAAQGRTMNAMVQAARQDPSKAEDMLTVMEAQDPKRAAQMRELLVPGAGFASSKEGAKVVRESIGLTKSVADDVQRLRELAKKSGKSLNPKIIAEVDTIRNGLIGKLRVPITGPGAMSDGEREMLQKMIPDVTSVFALDSSNKTRLDTLEARLKNAAANAARQNGLQVPQELQMAPQGPQDGAKGTTKDGRPVVRQGGKWVLVK